VRTGLARRPAGAHLCHQVVDEGADVAPRAREGHRLLALRAARRVEPGDQPLRRGSSILKPSRFLATVLSYPTEGGTVQTTPLVRRYHLHSLRMSPSFL